MHSIGLISDHILGMFNNRLDNTKKMVNLKTQQWKLSETEHKGKIK